MKIAGEFAVNIQPLKGYAESQSTVMMARMSIDKTFTGPLSATSKGEMISARSSVKSSAGYVAMEQVSGMLSGKKGTFVLQHYGTMHAGGQNLILEVTPDSGTDELAGLSGKMNIRIEDGKHFYDFEYEL